MDCCSENNESCCKVESVLTIDERGQMVLPKDIREKANIRAGDKLALVSFYHGTDVTCFALMKVDEINSMVKQILGPMIKETIR